MAKVSYDQQKHIEAMLAAVPILRLLERQNATMSFEDFAKEVGLMGRSEKMHVWYKALAVKILAAIDALAPQCNGRPVNTTRIV